jgi:DNA invertase Pin-like site-specific DNA recombinase
MIHDPHDPFKNNEQAEDCLIALAAGAMTEDQVAALTGIDRVSIRKATQSAIRAAQTAWVEYCKENPRQ